MKHVVRIILCAAVLLIGSGGAYSASPPTITCTSSGVTGINNVWCKLVYNYLQLGQTVCIAENLNPTTTSVTFLPSPPGGSLTFNLPPTCVRQVFPWIDGTTPAPQCLMVLSFSKSRKRAHNYQRISKLRTDPPPCPPGG